MGKKDKFKGKGKFGQKEKFDGEQQMADAQEEAARRGIEIWQLDQEESKQEQKNEENNDENDSDPDQINSSSTRRKRLPLFKEIEESSGDDQIDSSTKNNQK